MKALIYKKGVGKELCERNMPVIVKNTDAIVRVVLSSICASDLHIIKGVVPSAKDGIVLGHEFVGEIVAVGKSVKNLAVGDRVCANCETFCGECFYCKRGFVNNCVDGGWELGCRIDGCQAEYVRVPYADNCLTKLRENVSFRNALFVGDILSSGYFGAKMCEISGGENIAVIGAGPVGLCAMMCAKYLGAGKVIAIDVDEFRLQTALTKKLADIVLNPETCNIEHEVKSFTENRGADSVIECAGTDQTFEFAWKIARPNGIVGIVAMYEQNQVLPLPQMYGKNLTFKTGGVDAIHCEELVKLIAEGKFSTDFLISKTFKFDEIEEGYNYFEQKRDNCLKIAIDYS